jgi:hypothetical protein
MFLSMSLHALRGMLPQIARQIPMEQGKGRRCLLSGTLGIAMLGVRLALGANSTAGEKASAESGPLDRGANILALPSPDGAVLYFHTTESPVMAPGLADKFPQIKAYFGQSVDDPKITARIETSPLGLQAQVFSPLGSFYIESGPLKTNPIALNHSREDAVADQNAGECLARCIPAGIKLSSILPLVSQPATSLSWGSDLRVYRLAVASPPSFTGLYGGTVEGALSAIVTIVNRINEVYERDLGIRLQLVEHNELLIYADESTSPYGKGESSPATANQNQLVIDRVIGPEHYDLGHAFVPGRVGLSSASSVCINGSKATAVSGFEAQTAGTYLSVVLHEMGHQFGAQHTWNGVTPFCTTEQLNPPTAYEPGSGSTIMGYRRCGSIDTLQSRPDQYFHSASIEQIRRYVMAGTGTNCARLIPTGNRPPLVKAGQTFTIPKKTPFKLTATARDEEGDSLTYCWEELDLGAAQPASGPGSEDNGSSPLFRSFPPVTSSSRIFPRLSDILDRKQTIGEQLPNTSRVLRFRVTVRDNRADGGAGSSDEMELSVDQNTGPFLVISPNRSVLLSGPQTIEWKVAGTTNPPVSVSHVNILLSTNDGLDFPITLAADTPNDGSEEVIFPEVFTSTGRIKVEAANNIFFDISNPNFTIRPATAAPSSLGASLLAESCQPANGAIDPGEQVTVQFLLGNAGLVAASNVVSSLLPVGGVLWPSESQTNALLDAGDGVITNIFSFTADPNLQCGENLLASLQLQSGTNVLGTLFFPFSLGTNPLFTNSFTNALPIIMPGFGAANTYPSSIQVSGVSGRLSSVSATLFGLSRAWSDDMDVLLAGPAGQSVLLFSDAGLANPIENVSLTFNDAAEGLLPETFPIQSGIYKPTNYYPDDMFFPPAPAGPYGSALSVFNGINLNGNWNLFVMEDDPSEGGSIAGGWSLSLTTAQNECCVVSEPAVNSGPDITAADLIGSEFRIRFTTRVGHHYLVERKDALMGTSNWTALGSSPAVLGTGQTVQVIDSGFSGARQRFYRIREVH